MQYIISKKIREAIGDWKDIVKSLSKEMEGNEHAACASDQRRKPNELD